MELDMTNREDYIKALEREKVDLEQQLQDATQIIDSIREGAVDALVVSDDTGNPQIFAIQTADYTYRVLIEKFSEGALSISDTGLILYANEYFAKLVGVPSTEIAGKNFSDFLETPEIFSDFLSRLQDGPIKTELFLYINDHQLPVYLSLTDLNPFVPAIGIVVTDLSDKKKQEKALLDYQQKLQANIEELHHTNTNLEQVIHVISHDLKEPLRKIITYVSEVDKKLGETLTERDIKSLGIVNASAFRLNSLLDDIVKYAFTNFSDEANKVDLNAVLRDVLEDLEISIKENNAVIHYEKLPVISGSEVQMRQLFSNLIVNAIKYRKVENPTIEIRPLKVVSENGAKFKGIGVSDNGIGMHKSYLSQIFTIFKRLHNKNEYSGNGIGLAICKKIMDNHQGKIEVESVLGSGSTFLLYFPEEFIIDAKKG
ncbi:MAG: PAS domain-containing protein [Flavobacterium sp.]|nr:MAG: PAS domain-containing protein [Flavobacterium sp.]